MSDEYSVNLFISGGRFKQTQVRVVVESTID